MHPTQSGLHSYENCRVYARRSFTRCNAEEQLRISTSHQSRVTSHKSRACPPISERSTIASLHIEEGTRYGHR